MFMSIEIIQQRLLTYQCQTLLEQEHALKEIAQEIALMVLARSEFFRIAAFQGGTCLRILYGLERFSEDLDFVLERPDPAFNWEPYVQKMREEFSAYGYALEVTEKAKLQSAIKTTFLKADSQGGMLVLKDHRTNKPKLQIKLEIDTNPPQGSEYDIQYLDFPMPYSIRTQDLPSLFAGKCHALLCRSYVKGRDWYDFLWYIARNVSVNTVLLANALDQAGPWTGKKVDLTSVGLKNMLKEKIKQIDWSETRNDIARFLRSKEQAGLEVWSQDFFLSRVDRLKE
jgi:predicted nucleotidyltransferase component of viral defense system